MLNSFEFLTAMRYLRSKKERTFSVITTFSLLGIILGVAAIITVMSVMNGFREELVSKIIGINGHMIVRSNSYGARAAKIEEYTQMQKRIEDTPEVQNHLLRAVPIVESQVIFSKNGQTVGGLVKGIQFKKLMEEKLISKKYEGKNINDVKPNEIVAGYALLKKLQITIGDKITLISPQGNITAFGTFPKIQSFKVAGSFNLGMYEYDSSFVFMQLPDAQNYFNRGKKIDHFELFFKDPQTVSKFQYPIEKQLYNQFSTSNWQQMNSTYYNALKVERNVMFLILTLIIIVASFNIISSLVMLVKDKQSDIAVFRTIGASKKTVVKIFFISGSFIGVVGTFTGVLLGLIISWNLDGIKQFIEGLTGNELFAQEIYFLSNLPSKVMLADVIYVVILSLSISFIATLIPSFKASKTDPVEALRYE